MRRIDPKRLDLAPLKPTAFLSDEYVRGWNDLLQKLYGAAEPENASILISRDSYRSVCSECSQTVDITDQYCRRCGARFKNIKYIKED